MMVLDPLHNNSGSFPSIGLWITTFTEPEFNIPSFPTGIIFPVPIRVMGITGTPVFAATLNAPFCGKQPREIH